MTTPLLLDTCALIWLGNGDPLKSGVEQIVERASDAGMVYVSPVSAWEIGLISRPTRLGDPKVMLLPDPHSWFMQAADRRRFVEAPFNPKIAIQSSVLPGTFHNDPGDRLLVATAVYLGAHIVTRDALILDYAKLGWVQALEC